MYELKKLLSKHLEENALKYFLIISVFSAGVLLGFLCSRSVPIQLSDAMISEIDIIIENFSQGIFDRTQIFKTSFLRNLRLFIFISMCAFSMWLVPLSVVALGAYGFSIGFTISYMAVNFGSMGMAICMISVAFALLISVPVYVIFFVASVNNNRYKKYARNEKRFVLYLLTFLFLFAISMISILWDTLAVPFLINIICG